MDTKLTGALARSIHVVMLVSTPALLLPGTTADTALMVAVFAICAGIFTFAEYNSNYPSLVEFRDAPPFNRIRFASLFGTVFVLTVIMRGKTDPTTITMFFEAIGTRLGTTIDFPYSPVRLVLLMMPAGSPQVVLDQVRMAAGLCYLVSMLSLCWFILVMRLRGWPSRTGGFNVWVNLPTFDPTAGGDVVERLRRDGHVNLILGFLLPFLIPAVVKLASDLFNPVSLSDPHTLIWTMTAWAFLPASLLMRGIALVRVARMIERQRRRAWAASGAKDLLPV